MIRRSIFVLRPGESDFDEDIPIEKLHDYTQNITVPSYVVNSIPKTLEWEDADNNKHIRVVARKLKGSMSLRFEDKLTYQHFLDDITIPMNSAGYCIVDHLYVNNLNNHARNVKCIITIEAPNILPVIGTDSNEEIEISIEEV